MKPDDDDSVRTDGFGARLPSLVLGHLAILVLIATWGMGGNVPWSRTALQVWGSLGPFLTLALRDGP